MEGLVSSEREFQNELVSHLTEQGFNCQQYVSCPVGIADIVIDNAVIEVKHLPDREALFKAIGQAVLYRGAISKELDAKIICSYYRAFVFEEATLAMKQSEIELIPWMPGDPLIFETDRAWRVNNTYQVGDICWVSSLCCASFLKYNKCWAIVEEVCKYEYKIDICGKRIGIAARHLKKIEFSTEEYQNIKAVYERLSRLQQCDLDPIDDAVLEVLKRRTSFSQRQKLLLKRMEEDYRV